MNWASYPRCFIKSNLHSFLYLSLLQKIKWKQRSWFAGKDGKHAIIHLVGHTKKHSQIFFLLLFLNIALRFNLLNYAVFNNAYKFQF